MANIVRRRYISEVYSRGLDMHQAIYASCVRKTYTFMWHDRIDGMNDTQDSF